VAKPVILAVDDDAEVLQAVARDVLHGFGERFRVIRADSGQRALEVLRQVKLEGDAVALLLVDQRMPHMTGVELLAEATNLFPDAKRVLLTAYADTDIAIRAINEVRLDHYLVKPWDPPEERLYPVLDDLLGDWTSNHEPPFEGVRLVGHRWSPEAHTARDFLARSQVPYQWLDLDKEDEARHLLDLVGSDPDDPGAPDDGPLLVFPDGSVLRRPTPEGIADHLGLRGSLDVPLYDLVIVGGGPAGLGAAVYATSEGLRTALVERETTGGQAGMSSRIENYLGFPSGLTGADLARRATTQARRFGTQMLLTREAVALSESAGSLGISLADGGGVRAHCVLVCTGVSYRQLNVPGAQDLIGRGVYYGAGLSEVASVRGEDVVVVGGANSAGQAAIHFARVAGKVTMLVRAPSLEKSMSQYLVEQVQGLPNIAVRTRCTVAAVTGQEHLEGIEVLDHRTGERSTEAATSLFVFIGAQPRTDWLQGRLDSDDSGFLLTGADLDTHGRRKAWRLGRDPLLLETSVPGVFAAGDVRHGSGKRVATAVGEGAAAVMAVWQYRASVGLPG
jgi:thioredoxin reductase (NADPH)